MRLIRSMRYALRSGLLIAWLCVCMGQASVHAQTRVDDGEPKTVQDDRAQSFQAVSGGTKEDIAGGPLMLAAYAFVWLALFGYVFRMVRLQRGVDDNLARLERSLSSAPSAGEHGERSTSR